MFGVVQRSVLEQFFKAGFFRELVNSLLPAPEADPNSVRGVPFGVVQGLNWLYNVIAFELRNAESTARPTKGFAAAEAEKPKALVYLTPEFCPIHHFLRIVRTIVYRMVAARPSEKDYEALEVQMQVSSDSIITFAKSAIFRDAMLGGRDMKFVPLLLDILKKRLVPEWVDTMSKVLAALLNRPTDSIKSPFQSLLLYMEFASSGSKISAVHSRILTPVVSVYADLLEAGWRPTYAELNKRPKYGSTNLAENKDAKSSDLYRFAMILVNTADPLLRSACFRAIQGLGARPTREQPIIQACRFVNTCMMPPDLKTMKPYQGLPPQGLSVALPRKVFHLPPFAYSMWLYMEDEIFKSDAGRKVFNVLSHATPASTVPRIRLVMIPGHGSRGDQGQMELHIGVKTNCRRELERGSRKRPKGESVFKSRR
jgi:hypothetical protein